MMPVREKEIEYGNMMEPFQHARAINIKQLMQEPLLCREDMSPLQNLEISYCHFMVVDGTLVYILNTDMD